MHGYRKETSGCQWGEGREGQGRDRELKGKNYYV